MPKLILETESDTLDLNSIMQHDQGIQAVAGLTGLGLAPVDVQWLEGAGDGATYRSRRVLPRDIDLPLYFDGGTRQGLKALLGRFAVMLAGKVTLRLVDVETTVYSRSVPTGNASMPGLRWVQRSADSLSVVKRFYSAETEPYAWTETTTPHFDDESEVTAVYRVGGGDYTYGDDTLGESEFKTVVTLRAGDPFWRSMGKVEVSLTNTQLQAGAITLPNAGHTRSPILWEVTGPGQNFEATAPDGRSFRWEGLLLNGEKVWIDTAAGTVVDAQGQDVYSQVGQAPRFWSAPPGINTASVALDNTSSSFTSRIGNPRVNFVTNPSFEVNTAGWTLAYSAVRTANFGQDGSTSVLNWNNQSGQIGTGYQATFTTVTGLEVGQTYQFSAMWYSGKGTTSGPTLAPRMLVYNAAGNAAVASQWVPGNSTNLWRRVVLEFVASETSHILGVIPTLYRYKNGRYVALYTLLDSVYCGLPGEYFDGNTPAKGYASYQWDGTAHASKSRIVLPATNPSMAGVKATFYPRREVVI